MPGSAPTLDAASLAGGDPLPTWLSFDDATQTFSGTPPADFHGSLDLTVAASDGTLTVSDTFSLLIDPVIDRPTLTPSAPVFTTITEDAVTNIGRTVASLLGANAADLDGDALGIAVNGQADGNGLWQFSLDNGASWVNFGDVSDAGALLLRTTAVVPFPARCPKRHHGRVQLCCLGSQSWPGWQHARNQRWTGQPVQHSGRQRDDHGNLSQRCTDPRPDQPDLCADQ